MENSHNFDSHSGELSGYGVGTATAESEVENPFNWGPVSDNDTIRLEFPKSGTPPQWVEIKRYLTEEDDAFASDEAMRDGMKMMNRGQKRKAQRGRDQSEVRSYFKSGVYRLIILQRLIKAWSFVTPSGQPIPVSKETVAKLPTATRDFIMEKVEDLNPRLEDFEPAEGDEDEEDYEGENPLP